MYRVVHSSWVLNSIQLFCCLDLLFQDLCNLGLSGEFCIRHQFISFLRCFLLCWFLFVLEQTRVEGKGYNCIVIFNKLQFQQANKMVDGFQITI